MCSNTHIAIGLQECYFHSCSVAAQYTLRGVGGRSMDTRISFGGQKSGSFLHRIIPKNNYYFDCAISQMAAGAALQKLFKFTLIHSAVRKKYFLFKDFNYIKNIKNGFVHHVLLWERMCSSSTYILLLKRKLSIALNIGGN